MRAFENPRASRPFSPPGSPRLGLRRATRSWLGPALVSLLLAWPLSGFAQGELPAGTVRPKGEEVARRGKGMCREDVARLCPDVEPAQRHRCLASRRDELSPPCLEQIQSRSERAQQLLGRVSDACSDDIAKQCREASGPSVVGCLMSHYAELAPGCRQVLPQRQSQ